MSPTIKERLIMLRVRTDYLDENGSGHAITIETSWGTISLKEQKDSEFMKDSIVVFTDEFDVPLTVVDPAGDSFDVKYP